MIKPERFEAVVVVSVTERVASYAREVGETVTDKVNGLGVMLTVKFAELAEVLKLASPALVAKNTQSPTAVVDKVVPETEQGPETLVKVNPLAVPEPPEAVRGSAEPYTTEDTFVTVTNDCEAFATEIVRVCVAGR